MADSDKPAPPARVQLQIDEALEGGAYANFVLVNHTENEFVLDFAFRPPGTAVARVRARVLSSPRHTKRLLLALQKNLERYEERFGEIVLSDEPPPLH